MTSVVDIDVREKNQLSIYLIMKHLSVVSDLDDRLKDVCMCTGNVEYLAISAP